MSRTITMEATHATPRRGKQDKKNWQGKPLPATARAATVQKRYLNERGFSILAKVEEVAQKHHITTAQVALAWLMARPSITAPIASATSVEQTRELLGALDVKLTAKDLVALDKVSDWRS